MAVRPALVTALLAPLPAPHPARTQSVTRPHSVDVIRLVMDETNAFRRAQGARPTAPNPTLAAAAQEFADYMAHTDRYGHGADGRQPSERATAHGYGWCL